MSELIARLRTAATTCGPELSALLLEAVNRIDQLAADSPLVLQHIRRFHDSALTRLGVARCQPSACLEADRDRGILLVLAEKLAEVLKSDRAALDSLRAERDALQEAHDRLCAELAEAKAQIAKLHHQHTQALALLTEHHADRIHDLGLADAVTRKEFDECHAALRDTEKERDELRERIDWLRREVAGLINVDLKKREQMLELSSGPAVRS